VVVKALCEKCESVAASGVERRVDESRFVEDRRHFRHAASRHPDTDALEAVDLPPEGTEYRHIELFAGEP
jgi:hypothetical protein